MGRTKQSDIRTRNDWHKNEQGCWSLSLGERGMSVYVFQRTPGTPFTRRVRINGRNTDASLYTTSRPEARKRAEQFLRERMKGNELPERGPLMLGELWNIYSEGCARFQTNERSTQAGQRASAELLIEFFGAERVCAHFTLNDIDRYKVARAQGSIQRRDRRPCRPVGPRAVQADLQLLRAMLLWATAERDSYGKFLLDTYPLRGMKLPSVPKENRRRPAMGYDTYGILSAKAREMAVSASLEYDRAKWTRVEMALFIAEASGRRIGAILGLRWSDIVVASIGGRTEGYVFWSAEFDKVGREARITMPADFLDRMKEFRQRLAEGESGWLFPRYRDPQGRISSDQMGQWLDELMKHAGVEKRPGERWHSIRRAWATTRKGDPSIDAMAVGGWRDEKTFRDYQDVDAASMLSVLKNRKKLIGGKLIEISTNDGETMGAV